MNYKLYIIFILFFSLSHLQAHDGIFIRFSLGSGFMYESSSINESGFILPAKNHAIGYGFKKKYALYISDFGGLIHKKVGVYNYINLDALGLGFTYYLSSNLSLSFSAAHGEVAFAEKWYEATGTDKEEGYAISLSVEKEWTLSKHFSFSLGTAGSFFKTNNIEYEFLNLSLNCTLAYYLKSIQ